jgi:hypothetical protein
VGGPCDVLHLQTLQLAGPHASVRREQHSQRVNVVAPALRAVARDPITTLATWFDVSGRYLKDALPSDVARRFVVCLRRLAITGLAGMAWSSCAVSKMRLSVPTMCFTVFGDRVIVVGLLPFAARALYGAGNAARNAVTSAVVMEATGLLPNTGPRCAR